MKKTGAYRDTSLGEEKWAKHQDNVVGLSSGDTPWVSNLQLGQLFSGER